MSCLCCQALVSTGGAAGHFFLVVGQGHFSLLVGHFSLLVRHFSLLVGHSSMMLIAVLSSAKCAYEKIVLSCTETAGHTPMCSWTIQFNSMVMCLLSRPGCFPLRSSLECVHNKLKMLLILRYCDSWIPGMFVTVCTASTYLHM